MIVNILEIQLPTVFYPRFSTSVQAPILGKKKFLLADNHVLSIRGVDNFLEVGGLKIANVKFLHYHTHFCMTTPPYYNVCTKIWGGL